MSDCPICCETFNKSTHAPIQCNCGDCEFTSCKTCVRQYLLSTTNDPHCMKCKGAWNQNFMIMNLNRSYYTNDYMKHRKALLVEREISKLPDTMEAAGRHEKIEAKEIERDQLEQKKKNLREQINLLENESYTIYRQITSLRRGNDPDKPKQKFIMACPSNECRGYLSTQYKCELCKLHACSKCHEIIGYTKDAPHECDENSVKSAEMIKKDTKPCPSCGTRIFKMVGCSQMWCTNCNSAFDWRTGQIDNGAVHNPHYYEYLQQQEGSGQAPRNPGDVLCGGLIGYYQVRNEILGHLQDRNDPDKVAFCRQIWDFHRLINHITNRELDTMRAKVRDLANNEENRVEFILNKVTQEEMSTKIYRKDNLRRKYTEMLHIYELLSVVGIESFATLYNHEWRHKLQKISRSHVFALREDKQKELANVILDYNELIKQTLQEYQELCRYCNKELEKISVTYNQAVPQINIEKLEWTKGKKFSLAVAKGAKPKKKSIKEAKCENVKV